MLENCDPQSKCGTLSSSSGHHAVHTSFNLFVCLFLNDSHSISQTAPRESINVSDPPGLVADSGDLIRSSLLSSTELVGATVMYPAFFCSGRPLFRESVLILTSCDAPIHPPNTPVPVPLEQEDPDTDGLPGGRNNMCTTQITEAQDA